MEEENSFDMNDELSVSMPSQLLEDGSQDGVEVTQDDTSKASGSPSGKRAAKRLRAGVSVSPKKKRVQRAPCWKYFKEITVPSKKERGVMVTEVMCKFCHASYAYKPGGATSTMNRHLKKCTPLLNKLAKLKAQGKLNFAPDKGGALIVNPTEYDHEHTRKIIAKMIMVHDYPFRMVEHTWFNVLMKWLNPNYEFIGRKGIRNECMRVYESEKEILKKALRDVDSISLTCDLWTSNQNISYMCLVAHYIDPNWIMQCRVLNFIELDPPHKGIVIAQAVFDCLVEWKIEDKIMTITLDNANNNDSAVKSLVTKFIARKNSQFDPKYFHVRCSSHIVNLVVQDGLAAVEALISNLRNTVKYFKKSPSRLHNFLVVCNEYDVEVKKGLCLDCKTRWNSTYKMLDSCIHYRHAFTYYADKDTKYAWKPSPSDWIMYEKIQPILKAFAEVTTAFSGSIYPTANLFYLYIVNVKIAMIEAQKSSDAHLKSVADAMLLKFSKYWEEKNNIMVIATILDPRFKMRYIKWCFGKLYESIRAAREMDEITEELEGLYKVFEIDYRLTKMGSTDTSSLSQVTTSSSLASVVPSGFQSYLEENATECSKSELLIYLDEPNANDDKDFSLVNCWKVNAHRFPIVSKMAKKFLGVPASSVSSESTFSTGGRILDDYRSSLHPDMVQALVCFSSWIKGASNETNPPMFVV